MNLKRSIKIALAKRDMTGQALAKKLDMSAQQLGRIVRTGKANTVTLEKISEGLEMSVSELIALGEEK